MAERSSLASMPALQIYQMTVNYDKTPVLWDISLSVPEGVIVGILGPNGAGKSTLIKAALGLIQPLAGKVEFFGHPLNHVRKRVAYVPQRESVDWDFPITVIELVLMGRYGRLGLFRRPRAADHEAALHYLELVGLLPFADRQISQLSGGQQQRAFLARALIQEADLYFFDEPFAGVDATTEKVLIGLMKQLKEKGKTLFVIHHDLNTVESYFDWVVLLNLRIIAAGPLNEVYTPANLSAAYGRSHALFDEALRLSKSKTSGIL